MKKLFSLLLAMAMMLCCVSVFAETAAATTGSAVAKGFGGDISVTVTLEGSEIKSVEISGDGETDGIGKKIIEEWPAVFVATQAAWPPPAWR